MNGKGLVIGLAAAVSALVASTASAAGREDNSSLVVWIFLGFCALIVVAQLMPLLLQLRLFARQQKAAPKEGLETEPVKVTADK